MQLSSGDLNPHFFAYGQFPLYLTFFTRELFHLTPSYEISTYILRFWSAVFSIISVFVFYKIIRKISTADTAFLGSVVYIFTPGLIQLAHFGTTESLLILIFLTNILISFYLLEQPFNLKWYLLSSVVTGIGVASKLSALIFLAPILLVSLFNFFHTKSKLKTILLVELTILLTTIFFVIFSPYNLIENKDFLSSLKYETDVATGALPVFYTTQFVGTTPYLFQTTSIFPYAITWPIIIFSTVGLLLFIRRFQRQRIIILISTLIYFLYFGQLYVKWTRFMSPVFFIFPLLSSLVLSKIKLKPILAICLLLLVTPGLYFLRLYKNADIRVDASSWLINNLPENSHVLSEGGNVIDIPLTSHNLDVTNFDFYSLENNPQSIDRLVVKLSEADYIVVPSRRVFMNQKGDDFPISQKYFSALFGGQLGFTPIKTFTPNYDLFSNPELAEETWTVFDRPTIRIYKKTSNLSLADYEKIIK